MSMGRGPARDRLPDDEAQRIREGLCEARETMGVTIQVLADSLGWDLGKLKGALDKSPGRTLRVQTATAIFDGLMACGPKQVPGVPRNELTLHREAVFAIISECLKDSPTFRKWFGGDPEEGARAGRWFLPALIAPERIADIAQDLSEEMARTPGVGPRIRAVVAKNLEKSLRRHLAGYARGAYDRLRENGIDDDTARRTLAVFGWSVGKKERT